MPESGKLEARSRRHFIKTAGVGAVGMATLAGCAGGGDGGDGGDGGGSSDGGDGGSGGGSTGGFPQENIEMVIPVGEGGGLDTSLRTIQPYWEEELGTSLRFEYRDGAGTRIGLKYTFNQPPAGYTVCGNATPDLQFIDTIDGEEFNPNSQAGMVGSFVNDNAIIRIRKDDDRFSNLNELVEYAKENPRELNFSLSGIGNNLLSMMLIEEATGAKFQPILYDGGNDARLALLQGEVALTNTSIYSSLGIRSDTKVVGVHAEENKWSDLTNDAPTVNDALGTDISNAPGARRYILVTNGAMREENPERLDVLRETFTAVMENEEYLDELANMDPPQDGKIDHLTGEELRAEADENMELAEKYYKEMEKYIQNAG